MSFYFNWSTIDQISFQEWITKLMKDVLKLSDHLNNIPKISPPLLLHDLKLGTIQPIFEVEEFEINDNDEFKATLSFIYQDGDLEIYLSTNIETNPFSSILSKKDKSCLTEVSPQFILTDKSLSIPLLIKLSSISIKSKFFITFNSKIGPQIEFLNDPLKNIIISTNIDDTYPELIDGLKEQIERYIRVIIKTQVPIVIQNLCKEYTTPDNTTTGNGFKYRDNKTCHYVPLQLLQMRNNGLLLPPYFLSTVSPHLVTPNCNWNRNWKDCNCTNKCLINNKNDNPIDQAILKKEQSLTTSKDISLIDEKMAKESNDVRDYCSEIANHQTKLYNKRHSKNSKPKRRVIHLNLEQFQLNNNNNTCQNNQSETSEVKNINDVMSNVAFNSSTTNTNNYEEDNSHRKFLEIPILSRLMSESPLIHKLGTNNYNKDHDKDYITSLKLNSSSNQFNYNLKDDTQSQSTCKTTRPFSKFLKNDFGISINFSDILKQSFLLSRNIDINLLNHYHIYDYDCDLDDNPPPYQ